MSSGSAVSLFALALACTSFPSLGADRILMDRLGPTQATLFVSKADGSGERAITQSGSLDYDPSWSPTGDWIVFTSERGGSADLYRIHPDGTGLERLTDNPAYDDQGAFSPDGKRLVFVSTRAAGRANLWILDVVTRNAAHHRRRRRFSSVVVPRWKVDRFLVRSGQRSPTRQRQMGAPATGRCISDPPGWQWAATHL